MEKCILITGGAGYIGTNIINKLAKLNYKIVCMDNFSNSYEYVIQKIAKRHKNVIIETGDMLDNVFMENLFKKYKFNIVMHMAGKKYVKDSFYQTESYYLNNVTATQKLLDIMDKYKVKRLIFSSSITIYGITDKIPLTEDLPYNAQSPYAQTKVEGELLIKKWCTGTKSAVILRLSNPIGANVKCMLGDNSKSENLALLPYLISNTDKLITINGDTYPTKDGTTIRDYIHVEDVAQAFVSACETSLKGLNTFNIGKGVPGNTVLEVLKQVEKTVKKSINYKFGGIRVGDPAILITDTTAAKNNINFKAKKSLKDMVESQYAFNAYLIKNNK